MSNGLSMSQEEPKNQLQQPHEGASEGMVTHAEQKVPILADAKTTVTDKVLPLPGEPDCDYCENKRFVISSTGELKPCPRCNVAMMRKIEQLRAFSSLSPRTAQQNFDNFQTTFNGITDAVLELCLMQAKSFAENHENRWLVIWGSRGNGKSHLCASIYNHLIQRNIPAIFITFPELLTALKSTINKDATTEESYYERLNIFKTVPVLILDDVSAESSTPWSDNILFEIIDYRYRHLLSTVIVTNTELDLLEPRISSRLQDTTLCTIIENAAPDYRIRPLHVKKRQSFTPGIS